MQFPESWLREFCNPNLTTQQLADTLTMAGLEVEDLQPVAPFFSHVVVGHILEVEKHPDADRLRICKVDIGQAQALSIVCGAPNARVGISVPCAMVGARPPSAHGHLPFPSRTAGWCGLRRDPRADARAGGRGRGRVDPPQRADAGLPREARGRRRGVGVRPVHRRRHQVAPRRLRWFGAQLLRAYDLRPHCA